MQPRPAREAPSRSSGSCAEHDNGASYCSAELLDVDYLISCFACFICAGRENGASSGWTISSASWLAASVLDTTMVPAVAGRASGQTYQPYQPYFLQPLHRGLGKETLPKAAESSFLAATCSSVPYLCWAQTAQIFSWLVTAASSL